MKLLMFPLWASLVAEAAHASAPFPAGVPEPSSAVMLILGACAIGIGIAGRLRPKRPQ